MFEIAASELEKLRSRVRFQVCYQVGFACADVDDIVQETLKRFLLAVTEEKLRNPSAVGAFMGGISRNVILEYRRRMFREAPMPEIVPEPPGKSLPEHEIFELRDALAAVMTELSARDRGILQAFYLEEKSKEEIIAEMRLTSDNFRVVLCRAKERFREIYSNQMKRPAASSH